MHHTAGRGDPASVVNFWKQQGRGYGAQYIMDRNGVIHDTQREFGYNGTNEILNDPTRKLSNSNVVGMEIIAKNDADVTPQQAQAAAQFIQARYPSLPVYGHGQVNPGHKEATEGQSAVNAVMALRGQGGATPSGQPTPVGQPPVGAASAQQPQSQRDAHIQFIRDYATKIGVNPDLALGIASAEGLNAWGPKNPNAASVVDVTNGQPWSFGDFQLNVRGGLGALARQHGIDPADPNQWQAADRFALEQMKQGVGPWKSDPVAKQYLATGKVAPFTAGTTINTAGGPGSTINTTGGPSVGSQTGSPSGGAGAGASGVASTPGTSSTGQPQQALLGFQAGSPAEKSMLEAGKTLGLSGGGSGGAGGAGAGQADQSPQAPSAPPIPLAQAVGGPMMMGPGGQNTFGQRAGQSWLAAQGFQTQPSLAAFYPQAPPAPSGPLAPGAATGMPSMPGTTLNSPSQLQMALMTGAMNPYDLYANQAAGLGSA